MFTFELSFKAGDELISFDEDVEVTGGFGGGEGEGVGEGEAIEGAEEVGSRDEDGLAVSFFVTTEEGEPFVHL